MNDLTLIGKVLSVPEARESSNGVEFRTFLLQVKKAYKFKEGATEFEEFQITMFKNVAQEVADMIVEGAKILIKGHIASNITITKDGRNFYNATIVADKVVFITNLFER